MEETGRYGGIEKVEICLGSGCGVGVRVIVRVGMRCVRKGVGGAESRDFGVESGSYG